MQKQPKICIKEGKYAYFDRLFCINLQLYAKNVVTLHPKMNKYAITWELNQQD